MPAYATREDVLAELGGDRPTLEQRFDRKRWVNETLTSVTVDGLQFDVPTSILTRIDRRIRQASSRLNTAILEAYQAEPPSPYPDHLVQAAAQLAALNTVNTDGTRPEYLREMAASVDEYFTRIADMKLDLGIAGNDRPNHRAPGVTVVQGLGRNASSRRGRGRGYEGCC